jgi:hypothetical protein
MFAGPPFRWTDPTTWPWFVYVWLAMLLAGWAKPIWRWLERRQASSWPTAQGRVESVSVKPKKQFLVSTTPRGRAPAFTAELAYSYSVEGQYYSGHYERELGSEGEGWEFVRDLQGKTVIVSYNPRNAAKSTVSEESVATLLNTRPPAPEGGAFQAPVSDGPGWVKPLLWPFVALSIIGLALSLWVHIGALAGRKVAPEAFFWMLHMGIFVVWIPAVVVAQRRVGSMSRKDFWKVILRGSPDWMRHMVYGFLGYAVINFLLFMIQAPTGGSGANPPPVVWRGFSGHWMAFYSAALAILYSAAVNPPSDQLFQSRPFAQNSCVNGHPLTATQRFCPNCGQPRRS